MKLTFDQIRSITKGCCEFAEEDGGLWLHRFSEAQRAVYENNPGFAYSATQTAGVTLDFYTDAAALELTVDGIRDYDNHYRAFDLYVDGCFLRSIDLFSLDCGWVEHRVFYGPNDLRFTLPEGEKRVTLYLTWDASVRVRRMELTDASFCRPYVHKRTLVAFGDSITHGAFARYPSMTYICQTARTLDAELFNFGIGGECFRFRKIVKGTYPKADMVTVSYGTNDFTRRTAEELEQRLVPFFRQLTEEFPETPIFVILPLWRRMEEWREKKPMTLQQVRQRIAAECEKYPNITVCDGSKWVPHLPAFFGDSTWLHPNDLGHSQYAIGLTKAIAEKLAEGR